MGYVDDGTLFRFLPGSGARLRLFLAILNNELTYRCTRSTGLLLRQVWVISDVDNLHHVIQLFVSGSLHFHFLHQC